MEKKAKNGEQGARKCNFLYTAAVPSTSPALHNHWLLLVIIYIFHSKTRQFGGSIGSICSILARFYRLYRLYRLHIGFIGFIGSIGSIRFIGSISPIGSIGSIGSIDSIGSQLLSSAPVLV